MSTTRAPRRALSSSRSGRSTRSRVLVFFFFFLGGGGGWGGCSRFRVQGLGHRVPLKGSISFGFGVSVDPSGALLFRGPKTLNYRF